jgi:hypothetical protein
VLTVGGVDPQQPGEPGEVAGKTAIDAVAKACDQVATVVERESSRTGDRPRGLDRLGVGVIDPHYGPRQALRGLITEEQGPSESTIAHSSTPSPEYRTRTAVDALRNGTASAAGAPSKGETTSVANAAAPPITARATWLTIDKSFREKLRG